MYNTLVDEAMEILIDMAPAQDNNLSVERGKFYRALANTLDMLARSYGV